MAREKSNFREFIRGTPEYQEVAGQQQADQPRQATGVQDSLDPVMDFTKGDVEFWMQAATVLLLLLIYLEMRRNGIQVAVAGQGGR